MSDKAIIIFVLLLLSLQLIAFVIVASKEEAKARREEEEHKARLEEARQELHARARRWSDKRSESATASRHSG